VCLAARVRGPTTSVMPGARSSGHSTAFAAPGHRGGGNTEHAGAAHAPPLRRRIQAMKTILEHAQALATGQTTSEAIVDEALAAAERPDGEGKRVFIALDPEKVRAQARASDLLRKAGIVPSPLAGLPISIKDFFDVAGEVTTAGSVVLRDSAPASADAPAIARLRAAGVVLMGRTNLTEFAYSGLGINPHY